MEITSGLFGGLFGPSPEALQRQQQQQMEARAMNIARMAPGRAGVFYGNMAGQSLGQNLGAAFGAQDPQMVRRQKAQQILQSVQQQGVDPTSAEGLLQLAQALDQYPEFAQEALQARQAAAMKAQQQQQQALEQQLTQAKIGKEEALTEKALRDEGEFGFSPQGNFKINKKTGEVTPLDGSGTGSKLTTKAQDVEFLVQQGMPRQAAIDAVYKIKDKDGEKPEEKAGYIGKTGAYRNEFGEVFPATEMGKQRLGFDSAETLLYSLNKIDESLIKKAESMFDVTEPGVTQSIASKVSPKTVDAQTRIAALELKQKLENLPPGSASDADVKQAARQFPGFGNAENLRRWINETKNLVEFSLSKQSERYGFNRKVKATPAIQFGGKNTTQSTPTDSKTRTTKSGIPYTVEE